VAGRARCADLTLENGDLEFALGEVKGETGAHHARADDDGIVGLSHGRISFLNTRDTKSTKERTGVNEDDSPELFSSVVVEL
jgi:hypothetical protein